MNQSKSNRWFSVSANAMVLGGLLLLAYEVHQNAGLTRAQISMDRTIATTQILSDAANGGELIRIDVKLREEVDGFPHTLGWSKALTAEDRRRYEFWMLLRLVELNNDWYQCTEGLLSVQICEIDVPANMRSALSRFYELGISFTRSDAKFVTAMQEHAIELGLPAIDDLGVWSQD